MLLCLLWTGSTDVYGQKARQRRMGVRVDSLALKQQAITDSLATDSITTDSLAILNQKEIEKLEAPVDTALLAKKNDSIQNALPTEKKRFIPNSNRATWLALIIPGGGQIYNRKYWKLPIVYGGFMGCAYALSWNGKMYKDYSQAYLDMDDASIQKLVKIRPMRIFPVRKNDTRKFSEKGKTYIAANAT